jgi:hypothetical protein
MRENGNFGDIPFTDDQYRRCLVAVFEGEESVNDSGADEPGLLAALIRVWLESAASGAMYLGGVSDINWCRAEFLASCSRAFDECWDEKLQDIQCYN